MTPKEFFTGRTIVFFILVFIGFVIFACVSLFSNTKETPALYTQGAGDNTTPPTFVWSYEKADSLNLDGMPNTDIFLEAIYSNGGVERKLIDTTPGSCNDLPDTDVDSVAGSTNAQCYSAGLGYRFKITKGESSYRVERKTFEEGLPDYTPPPYEYEVIAEFPFSN